VRPELQSISSRRHHAICRRLWARLAIGCFLAIASAAVSAQTELSTDIQRAPTLTVERYTEDWSWLSDPARQIGHWTEPYKYIPLSGDGWAYLSTGTEARVRYEQYRNPGWGAAPNDAYTWYRLMPYLDLHLGNFRLFAQPLLSAIYGTHRAVNGVDTTGTDILQAFAEVDVDVGGNYALQWSLGRKLLSFGAGRFIDTRYGPNIPQALDGTEVTLAGEKNQLSALYFKPVDSEPGNFNDRALHEKTLWGLYATHWLAEKTAGIDYYYLGLRDRRAVFDQGAGREVVNMVGSRFFGDTGASYWNFEGAIQRGSFAGKRVEAWGVGGEVGRRFRDVPTQPEIALTIDVISGDENPDDSRLGTFNPLFPRGKYFDAQSPIGPRNLIHVQPSLTVHPTQSIAVTFTATSYWRESTHDGIYAIPGYLVRSGKDSDARFIGEHFEIATGWQATRELNLSASMGAFVPGAYIHDTGPSRVMKLAGAMATFRF
jgi:hypothetical protein